MKRISKKDKLLRILKMNRNRWVSVWDIIQIVKTCHHTNLVMLLRREWYEIVNKLEYNKKDNTTYSSYMLVMENKTLTEMFNDLFSKI